MRNLEDTILWPGAQIASAHVTFAIVLSAPIEKPKATLNDTDI